MGLIKKIIDEQGDPINAYFKVVAVNVSRVDRAANVICYAYKSKEHADTGKPPLQVKDYSPSFPVSGGEFDARFSAANLDEKNLYRVGYDVLLATPRLKTNESDEMPTLSYFYDAVTG